MSSPDPHLLKITNGSKDQDPQTVLGLVYRLTGDPPRVLVLIGSLAALAGVLVLTLSAITSLSVSTPIAGVANGGGGVMLIGFMLRQVIRFRRRSR